MGCRLSKAVQLSGLRVNKIPLELELTQFVRPTSPRPRDSTLKISGCLKIRKQKKGILKEKT